MKKKKETPQNGLLVAKLLTDQSPKATGQIEVVEREIKITDQEAVDELVKQNKKLIEKISELEKLLEEEKNNIKIEEKIVEKIVEKPVEVIKEVEVEKPVEIIREKEKIVKVKDKEESDKLKKKISEQSILIETYEKKLESAEKDKILIEERNQLLETEKQILNELAEKIEQSKISTPKDHDPWKRMRDLFIYHNQNSKYELLYNGTKIYSSLTHNVDISFEQENVKIGNKKYPYISVRMKLLNK